MSGLQFAAPIPPPAPKPALLLVFALASCVGQRAAVVTPGGSPAARHGSRAGAGVAAATIAAAPSHRRRLSSAGCATPRARSPWAETLFAVADDEDNVLRVYDSRRGGDPIDAVDVSPALELPAKKRPPELDIEAATRLGENAYWLTSHGRDRKGKRQEARFRFFATSTSDDGRGIAPIGRPYNGLLDDLIDGAAAGAVRPGRGGAAATQGDGRSQHRRDDGAARRPIDPDRFSQPAAEGARPGGAAPEPRGAV